MQYNVTTEEFEGPLSLLLSMVIEKKVGLDRISLAQITDEYIVHIRSLPFIPTHSVSTTIVIISTLILIKATALMPQLSVTDEEEGDMRELENRLSAYSRVRKTANKIVKSFFEAPLFIRGRQLNIEPVFSPDKLCTIENLIISAKNIIDEERSERAGQNVFEEKAIEPTVSIEEMMESLIERIQNTMEKINFSKLTESARNKLDVVISFLAVLELMKQGTLTADQESGFGEISIRKNE